MLEVFCYIFTLAAFSHGQSLQLSLASHVFHSSLITGIRNHGLLIGRSIKLFDFILQISTLTCQREELDAMIVSNLEAIEFQLSNWHSIEEMYEQNAYSADEIVTTELYRLACIIHLKLTLTPHLALRSSQIQDYVSQFVASLEMLPILSPVNNILCWPLVVVGMAATTGSHRRIIAGRLQKNHERWRSEILTESLALLHKKWREDRTWEKLGTQMKDLPNFKTSNPAYYSRQDRCPIVFI